MHYLTPTDLLAIHELLLSEFGGMRGVTAAGFGRLEAAAALAQASMKLGEIAYRKAQEKEAGMAPQGAPESPAPDVDEEDKTIDADFTDLEIEEEDDDRKKSA